MLQGKTLAAVAALGLLAGAAANAGDRYQSEPQVRLGIEVLWGGYGYAPPPPPVVWYPAQYAPYRHYDDRHYRGHDRGWRRNAWRHGHRHSHRGDDCDD